jgi:hypothetical protein
MPSGKRDPAAIPEGRFFCSVEWHLQQLKSRLACPLYSWGRRLSTTSGVFSASAEHVAEYFGVNRKTALSTLRELAELGFFIIDRIERGKPNTYKTIDHDEWAEHNPGRCVEKASFPWEGQGDRLGCHLYQISGGRVKFWPRQMTGLRNLGFSDEQIIEQFRTFMVEADYTGRRWKHAYYDFRTRLKVHSNVGVEEEGGFPDMRDILRAQKMRSIESSPTDSVGVQSSGHPPVQSNGLHQSSRTDPSSRSSSRKEVDESELTIPAPRRVVSYPSFKNKEKAAAQKKEEKPYPQQTPQECEARVKLLQDQARQLKEAEAEQKIPVIRFSELAAAR